MLVSLRLAGRLWLLSLEQREPTDEGGDQFVELAVPMTADVGEVSLADLAGAGIQHRLLNAHFFALQAAARHYRTPAEASRRLRVVATLLERESVRRIEDDTLWMRPADERAALWQLYARSEFSSVRHGAANGTDEPGLLAMLAFDSDAQVRWAVADNPVTPDHARERLAGDDVPEVRAVLAGRTCALALHERLAGDVDEAVRLEVAEATPHDSVLVTLAYDHDRGVRKTARRALVAMRTKKGIVARTG